MPETIYKLQPDRALDLGFFNYPSSNAALHSTSSSGWKLSGKFRTQHDYAIVEWNKYNRWDHPRLRYLPDGSLGALTLTYDERRIACQPVESSAYAYTDWPDLLVWARAADGNENLYRVPLKDHATPVASGPVAASASFTIGGTVAENDVATVTIMTEKYAYTVQAADTLESVAAGIAAAINTGPPTRLCEASSGGANVLLTARAAGADGNLVAFQVTLWHLPDGPGASLTVTPMTGLLSGGSSDVAWRITLDFGSLLDKYGNVVPTNDVRRLRWTYSPPLRAPAGFNGSAAFEATEFEVTATNWALSGANAALSVAGPRSHRLDPGKPAAGISLVGPGWSAQQGNVFAEAISYTTGAGDYAEIRYAHPLPHDLYLGTQRTFDSAIVRVQLDSEAPFDLDLYTPGAFPSDIFPARERLATNLPAGPHTIRVTHTGTRHAASTGMFFYFDFLEVAVPANVPDAPEVRTDIGLATDYDTAALWLSPERLAWSLDKLGLKGELNHYAGNEFFYEKQPLGWEAASGTVTVGGTVTPGDLLTVTVGGSVVTHAVAYGDALESIAAGLAMALNVLTSVWAQSSAAVVTIRARVPGAGGNAITLGVSSSPGATETLAASGLTLDGGVDGAWEVDAAALPVLNRAARNWHRALAAALNARGMTATMALSLELKHAPSAWGQKFNDGSTVLTATGAVQTCPSHSGAKAFWKECYRQLAEEMQSAGAIPRLQFGEVQWWYFAGGSPASMAYYDAATTADFQAAYGRPLHVFTAPNDDPSVNSFADADFLRDRLGAFCDEIRSYVAASYPGAAFETLWPRDLNDPDFNPLNYHVNLPRANWSAANLAAFKTEAFQESNPQRNMNKAAITIRFPFTELGFSRAATRHLIGAMAGFPAERQVQVVQPERIGLITLWAWDQFCSIGRVLPFPHAARSAQFVGA